MEAQKKLVEELKVEWKLLWSERFDDKLLAEGVSVSDYQRLLVERGTIIHATRDYKALSFKEILQLHLAQDGERFAEPENHVGGWRKFIKTEMLGSSHKQKVALANSLFAERAGKRMSQQPKKGGRGWLHKP